MRIVTAAVMASTLAVSSLSHAAEVGSVDNWHPGAPPEIACKREVTS